MLGNWCNDVLLDLAFVKIHSVSVDHVSSVRGAVKRKCKNHLY